jgi:predicted aspartyl protease
MSTNRLVSSHFPYVPIRLHVRQQDIAVEALLDTGFDGDVAVPSALLADGQPPNGYLRWMLADGSRVLTPYYLGTVTLGPLGPFPAVVTALGNESLLGQGLAQHVTIILDHGQQVIVEP